MNDSQIVYALILRLVLVVAIIVLLAGWAHPYLEVL